MTALDNAPLPLGEANAALTRGVDALASVYLERMRALLDQVPRGQPVAELLTLLVPDERSDPRLTTGFVLAAMRETLLALWRSTLQELYERDAALTAAAIPRADRPARQAALAETLFELELSEERAIVEAARCGQAVDRRADADPRAIFHESVLEATPAA